MRRAEAHKSYEHTALACGSCGTVQMPATVSLCESSLQNVTDAGLARLSGNVGIRSGLGATPSSLLFL